jgi:hypothetical protein
VLEPHSSSHSFFIVLSIRAAKSENPRHYCAAGMPGRELFTIRLWIFPCLCVRNPRARREKLTRIQGRGRSADEMVVLSFEGRGLDGILDRVAGPRVPNVQFHGGESYSML